MPRKTNDLEKLANAVIETSLHWTGADEDAIPGLKKIRTLAGLALKEDKSKNVLLSVFAPEVTLPYPVFAIVHFRRKFYENLLSRKFD